MANQLETQSVNVGDDELMIVGGGQVIVHFEGTKRQKTAYGTYTADDGDKRNIVFWGERNNHPDYRELLIGNNNIVPQLIATKRNIILGGGLMAYKEVIDGRDLVKQEVLMPPEYDDWLEEYVHEEDFLETQTNNLLKHGNIFTEFTRRGDDALAAMKAHECRYVRAEKQNSKGVIPNYYLSGRWGATKNIQRLMEKKSIQMVPTYQRDKKQPNFIVQHADKLMGGPYYYTPHWEGSLIWIQLSNLIPQFHLANIENGYSIRYLIKVPQDYYYKSLSEAKRLDEKNLTQNLMEAKQNFKRRLNQFLSGAENAGRGLIVTKHLYNHLQKESPEIEIVPLKVDLKDEAMLKLFESSNTANTSAHGTPPALAGIATGAKMTSGSEIRNLYNFYQLATTRTSRKLILKPLNMKLRSMDIQGIKIGFRDIIMETTDKNPNGVTESKAAQ